MSSDVTQGVQPDQYGQLHPIETPEMIQQKRQLFDQEIGRLPSDRKVHLQMAEEKCPQLLTDEFKLMFLRCEVFNADKAAARYAKYWDQRVTVLGPDKAFQPLSLNGNLKDCRHVLQLKIIMTIQAENRTMIFVVPANFNKRAYTVDEFRKAMWYVFHSALEDANTQKRGLCIINFAKNWKASEMGLPLAKKMISDVQGCLPVRLSAYHICHPNAVFRTVFPVVALFMGERMRKRVLPHSGSDSQVIQELDKYGISKSAIPKIMGGEFDADATTWYEKRLVMGGGTIA